jgi:hypothetical protein
MIPGNKPNQQDVNAVEKHEAETAQFEAQAGNEMDQMAGQIAAARAAAAASGEPAVIHQRSWVSVTTSPKKMTGDLNRLQQGGWQIVHVIPNGIQSHVIVATRVDALQLPDVEVEPVEDTTSPEAAPPIVDESEDARRRWAEETGGDQGEAQTEDTPIAEPAPPSLIVTDL